MYALRVADGHKLRRKVESSSSEANIVQIGAESLKIFSKPNGKEKGPMDHPSLRWREKSSSRFEFWARKPPRGPSLSKQQCPALTSL